jgi:hypothetical protein
MNLSEAVRSPFAFPDFMSPLSNALYDIDFAHCDSPSLRLI